jgi:homoserine kinase type II
MAVYTDVGADELNAFLGGYDLGALLSYKGIAEGVENSNFLVHTAKGNYILTLYEKRVKAADVPFFLALMEHLARRGINCPQPVHTKKGAVLGELAGRPAAIVTFLDGVWIRRPNNKHCGAVGGALAKLHLAGADFGMQRANALSVESWRGLFGQAKGGGDSVQPGLSAEIEKELGYLESNWPAGLPRGVIHADLFPDNVFFLGENLSGLIDFYFACTDTLAYDLAVCLNAWCFEPDHSYNVTKGRAMLSAYGAVRALSKDEREALPVLARGAALRFLLTRLVDWLAVPDGALVRPKDPLEYFRKLRFHQSLKSVRDYGLDA